MIPATAADQPAIAAFLEAHLPAAFYPLTNLVYFGIGNIDRAMRFWLWRDGDRLNDVLGMSAGGFLYPVFTTDVTTQAAALLVGAPITGMAGPPDQIIPLRRALAIGARPRLDFTEPVYHLSLDRLAMPDTGDLALCPLDAAPADVLTSWRALFLMETQANLAEVAVHRAIHDLAEIRRRKTYRVLIDRGRPVAMTGFNAAFARVVQVGGVFVPPDLRSRGYGRAAVALHLQQAVASGVSDAYLSAATAPAARAYEALGFVPYGHYTAVVYDEGQMIGG